MSGERGSLPFKIVYLAPPHWRGDSPQALYRGGVFFFFFFPVILNLLYEEEK